MFKEYVRMCHLSVQLQFVMIGLVSQFGGAGGGLIASNLQGINTTVIHLDTNIVAFYYQGKFIGVCDYWHRKAVFLESLPTEISNPISVHL